MNTQHYYNPNLRLSPHFRLGEFTRSITAERLGISNDSNPCAATMARPSASPAASAHRH